MSSLNNTNSKVKLIQKQTMGKTQAKHSISFLFLYRNGQCNYFLIKIWEAKIILSRFFFPKAAVSPFSGRPLACWPHNPNTIQIFLYIMISEMKLLNRLRSLLLIPELKRLVWWLTLKYLLPFSFQSCGYDCWKKLSRLAGRQVFFRCSGV